MFLHSESILQYDFGDFFRMYEKIGIKQQLLSYYGPEEIAKIEFAIDENTVTVKRDYPMRLIATRLGLRRCKRFENQQHHWNNNEISLVQHMTKQTITLPLLKDIREVIIRVC